MRNTSGMNHENMHCDHIRWESENSLWLKNIEEWDQEINEARETLKEMQDRLLTYIDLYEQHRQAILEQQAFLQKHEAHLQQTQEEDTDMRMIAYHQVEADKHEKYKKAHEQMKSCHKSILSMMNGLKFIMDNNCVDKKVSEQGYRFDQ